MSSTTQQSKNERECPSCHEHKAETLFVLPYDICHTCNTLLARTIPDPIRRSQASYLAAQQGLNAVPEIMDAYNKNKLEPNKNIDAAAKAQKELAGRILRRRRLLPYIQYNEVDYQAGWVHKDICQRLEKFSQDVIDKKSPRLMLFMPPRHGKSLIASVNFPAWHLGNNPRHEVIACSYSASLAMKFSRKVRAQLRSKQYRETFPDTALSKDTQAAEEWATTAGGGYVAAGVSGPITGKGAHVLIIDDPVKNRQDAESETKQEENIDWYTSTAYTRLAPGGGVLIILTRWHDADLAGKLLEQARNDEGDQWEVVEYPAVALEDERYRSKGEALHPDRYDTSALKRIEKALPPRDWWALYQQQPVSDEGDYFKRDDIQYFNPDDINMDKMTFYQAWDLAIGEKETNDYSVGICAGIAQDGTVYIVDVVRGRWDAMELVENILDFYDLWRPSIVGIERGHIDMAIGPFLDKRKAERRLHEMYVKELKTGRRDKEARARAIQGRLQQGKVLFPEKEEFTSALIAEMLRFPSGVHDDQVDALAWLGLMMSEFSVIRDKVVKKPSWRDRLEKITKTRRTSNAMSA